MAISRMQMNRQLRAGGGIMDITPRENFGIGSSLKKFVRKVIPNEVAEIATKAAPFVAPFNPLLAAGMAGVGGFDKSGSISGALRSGALTYGLGNLARVVGGAGFQAGLKAPGTGTGFGSYFTSPMSGQQLFGAPRPEDVGKQIADQGITSRSAAQIGQPVGGADPGVFVEQLDFSQIPTQLSEQTKTDLFKKVVGMDTPLAERTGAIKELGGRALKAIYTDKEGNLDKTAIAATIGGIGSYMEAKKLAEESDLVDDADEYTEEMYEADKAKYAEKYGSYLTPEAFGLKEGGRVKLQGGGIPSIMLEKKDYNFMDLVDEDAEEEYYKKKAEELDRKYNPQNYNDIIPKEKPMDQYMLNEIMSERGMNTLSEEARDDAMKMYAERAYKKGQISEDEYREIMGFKVGGRVGYKGGTDNPFLQIIDKVAPEEDPFQKLITKISPLFIDEKGDYREGLQKAKFALSKFLTGKGTDLDTGSEWYNKLDDDTQKEIIKEKIKYRDQGYIGGTPMYDEEFAGRYGIGGNYASGGIINTRETYAMGSEVPLRENQAGVREMDFRQTGGFVPPIGVKEKADDIPAMLSNNEFVFTADAVRAAGGGSVNKGAQKMYNLMKSLENKVV